MLLKVNVLYVFTEWHKMTISNRHQIWSSM